MVLPTQGTANQDLPPPDEIDNPDTPPVVNNNADKVESKGKFKLPELTNRVKWLAIAAFTAIACAAAYFFNASSFMPTALFAGAKAFVVTNAVVLGGAAAIGVGILASVIAYKNFKKSENTEVDQDKNQETRDVDQDTEEGEIQDGEPKTESKYFLSRFNPFRS